MSRQYLVYGIADFVGTVGGSLGLFLGFSFFDVASQIIDTIIGCWKKHRN